jgi:membrane protein implicated in regulation of membrane protease activity
MKPDIETQAFSSRRRYRWCLVFPFIWQGGLAPVVNDVAYRPFGLPFAMAWQLAGIVLTSVVIAWVFRRDRQTGVEEEEDAFLRATADSSQPQQ